MYKYIDKLVADQYEIINSKGEDYEPTCLADIMLDSEMYKNQRMKLANDLIIAMIGSTDTSRLVTIMALIYFSK